MKNRTKFVGIIALVAVIGFVGVSCDSGGSDFNAPSPSIPNRSLGLATIPALSEGFFSEANLGANNVVVDSQARANMALPGILDLVGNVMGFMGLVHEYLEYNFENDTFTGRTFAWDGAAVPTGFDIPEHMGILTGADFRSGNAALTVSGQPYWTQGTTGSYRHNINNLGVRFGFEHNAFGNVVLSGTSNRNWNPTSESGTSNYGFTMVVAFNMGNLYEGATATDPDAFHGRARIRVGFGGRYQGPRGFYGAEFTTDAQRNATYRMRSAESVTFEVQFFGPPPADAVLHTLTLTPEQLIENMWGNGGDSEW